MSDIVIYEDGDPEIVNFDFQQASYDVLIGQKIYRALMNMPMEIVSGMSMHAVDSLREVILGYLADYFSMDSDIAADGFTVELSQGNDNESVAFSLSYAGTSPDGKEISSTFQHGFSYGSGVLRSVDYTPLWLRTKNTHVPRTIYQYVTITASQARFIVPVEPYSEDGGTTAQFPIMLCAVDSDRNPVRQTKTFSIPITLDRMNYQLSEYIPEFDNMGEVILTIAYDETSITYTSFDAYGDIVIHARDQEGTITGTVTVLSAIATTTLYEIVNDISPSPVFPLRSVIGHYAVVFPVAVSPGQYMIQYTGMVEV